MIKPVRNDAPNPDYRTDINAKHNSGTPPSERIPREGSIRALHEPFDPRSSGSSVFDVRVFQDTEIYSALSKLERIKESLPIPKNPKIITILEELKKEGPGFDYTNLEDQLPSDLEGLRRLYDRLTKIPLELKEREIDVSEYVECREAAQYLLAKKGTEIISNYLVRAKSEKPGEELSSSLGTIIEKGFQEGDPVIDRFILGLIRSIFYRHNNDEETGRFKRIML